MALTPKVNSIARNRTPDASDTLSSGLAKAQVFRGQGNVEPLYQIGSGNLLHSAVAEYNFAVDGALVVGNNGLGVFIPTNAVVDDTIVDVITAPVTGTLLGVSLENDNDVVGDGAGAGVAVGGVPWIVGVWKGIENLGGDPGASAVKTTTQREIMLKITGAANTAGKVIIIVTYHMSTI